MEDHNQPVNGQLQDWRALFSPARLPNGRTLLNRFVKVALYEHLAVFSGGPPNAAHLAAYAAWADGGWGMLTTGNVQVSSTHLTLGRDLVIPAELSSEALAPWRELAATMHRGTASTIECGQSVPPLAIVQLSHAGRQSPNILGGRWPFARPSAPSAVPLGRRPRESRSMWGFSELLHAAMFQTPKEMNEEEVDDVVRAFVRGARMAAMCGFDGVELHAAHGYLIAQFISPKTNYRSDVYATPIHLLHCIVSAIRAPDVVPPNFVLGIKLNSSDYLSDARAAEAVGTGEDRALEHIKVIASWAAVDYIQVSGGDYENPDFMDSMHGSRQALFAHFAQHALATLRSLPGAPLVMLTGGLRTLPVMTSALKNEHAHLLGLGRMAIIHPDLPRRLLDSLNLASSTEPPFLIGPPPGWNIDGSACPRTALTPIMRVRGVVLRTSLWIGQRVPVQLPKLIGAGTQMAWYIVQMRCLAVGEEVDYAISGVGAIVRMWVWLAPEGTDGAWVLWALVVVIVGGIVGKWYS